MKKIALALGILILAVSFWHFWGRGAPGSGETESSGSVSSTEETASLSDALSTGGDSTDSLPAELQAEVEKCLGRASPDMAGLEKIMRENAGPVKKEVSEWKNMHFEDERGNRFRLRVTHEAGEPGGNLSRLQLFSVDQEGLPDPVEIPEEHKVNPSEEVIRSYWEGKNVTEEMEAVSVVFQNGGELAIEKVNGQPKTLEYKNGSMSLGCSTAFQKPGCRCSR